ncbi:hypothetical protein JTX96_001000 [Escherichia coli]|nr:hypothetical protein [Escherichia coli]
MKKTIAAIIVSVCVGAVGGYCYSESLQKKDIVETKTEITPIDTYFCEVIERHIEKGGETGVFEAANGDGFYNGITVNVKRDRTGFKFTEDLFIEGRARVSEGLKKQGDRYVSKENNLNYLQFDDYGTLEKVNYSEVDSDGYKWTVSFSYCTKK